jgi:hypothetical protein
VRKDWKLPRQHRCQSTPWCIAFGSWDRGPSGVLAVRLEHQYTSSGLSGREFRGLKGCDVRVAGVFEKANSLLPPASCMQFCMAAADRTDNFAGEECGYNYGSRYNDRYGNEKFDSGSCSWDLVDFDEKLDEMYTVHGETFTLGSSFRISFPSSREAGKMMTTSTIAPNDADDDGNNLVPDKLGGKFWKFRDDDVEGYTGNAGLQKTTTYSRHMILMWPAANELSFLLSQVGVRGGVTAVVCMEGAGTPDTPAAVADAADLVVRNWSEKARGPAGYRPYSSSYTRTDASVAAQFLRAICYLPDRVVMLLTTVLEPSSFGLDGDLGQALARCCVCANWNCPELFTALLGFIGKAPSVSGSACAALLKKPCVLHRIPLPLCFPC